MKELITTIILIGLLVGIASPVTDRMPEAAHMTLLALLVASFGCLAVFILRERASDEREAMHRMHAGRIAFLVGAGVAIIGIVVQSTRGIVDPWLVGTLVAMSAAKVVAHYYEDRRL